VLPIGGLKEKLLAAHRGGIETIVIPHENEKDLADIPKTVLDKLEIKPVRWIDDVLAIALQDVPTPLESVAKEAGAAKGKKSKKEDNLRHH